MAKICDRVVLIRKGKQISDINVKAMMAENPSFDFEEYFLSEEGEAALESRNDRGGNEE